MPQAALRYCATPTCPNKVTVGRCAACATKQEHGRVNYSVRRLYRTARWRTLRIVVLQEQPLCPRCEAEGRLRFAAEVDHIEPHNGNLVLFWDRRNLQGLCTPHHTQKTGRGL